MKNILIGVIIFLLCATPALAQKPKTVDEAVDLLRTKWLKPKDLDWVLRNPKERVVRTLYRPFGTGVRNEFGLWGDNQALRDSCGNNNPEGCSVVIFERLWESVRRDADPTLVREIDCQFELVRKIRVNRKGFDKLTTGELLKALQSQIDEQLARVKASETQGCQNSLTLEIEGKRPNMNCFVDARFIHVVGEEDNLETTLAGLGFLNLFSSSHVPPKITLNFARECQFPTPPRLFGAPRRSQN